MPIETALKANKVQLTIPCSLNVSFSSHVHRQKPCTGEESTIENVGLRIKYPTVMNANKETRNAAEIAVESDRKSVLALNTRNAVTNKKIRTKLNIIMSSRSPRAA
jgi:hypothetical protein